MEPLNLKKELLIEPGLHIWEALYNPMTWESSYETLSVHLSRDGAERAIELHKMTKLKEWEEMYPRKKDRPYKFGNFEDWKINEIIVLP